VYGPDPLNGQAPSAQNVNDRVLYPQTRGRGNYDRRHVFSASWLWSPQVHFDQPVLKRVLDGWSIGAIYIVQSGAPLNFVMGTDVALDGTGQQNPQHAQLAPGITYGQITVDHPDRNAFVTRFFNTAAFVPVAQLLRGIYGNAGRNIINGPVREPFRIEIRGELASSGSFGRILSAQPGRVIQLAAKIIW
jgi:hypothetical protein